MAEQPEVVIVGADGTEHVFPPGFDPKRAAAIVRQQGGPKAPSAPASTSGLDRLLGMMPTVGGMVGGAAGGIPGAALGGAAGEGYQQLLSHARELPGAARDVASNLVTQPAATIKGAAQGIGQGVVDSGLAGGVQALYELGGRAVSGALSAGGRAVYRGYLKPSLSERLLPKAKEIVETGIREWLPVTEVGAAKAEQIAGELNREVERILTTTPGEVNLHDVANQVRTFAKRKYFLPGKPTADYEAAMKVAEELDTHPSMTPTPPRARVDTVDLPTANTIKRGLDETVGDANFGVERGAVKTTQKVARRAMRKEIETIAPKVGPLNERERQLIDAAEALNRATGREANRNQLFGVPTIVSGAAGMSELAHGASRYGAGALALAARIGLTPAVATRAAILAAKLGDQMPGTAVADVARVAVQVVSEAERQPQ